MKYKKQIAICILGAAVLIAGAVLFFWLDYQHSIQEKRDEMNAAVEEISGIVRDNADGLEKLCDHEMSIAREGCDFEQQGEFQDMRNIIFNDLKFDSGKIYTEGEYILFFRPRGRDVIILKYQKEADTENSSSGYTAVCDHFTIFYSIT